MEFQVLGLQDALEGSTWTFQFLGTGRGPTLFRVEWCVGGCIVIDDYGECLS